MFEKPDRPRRAYLPAFTTFEQLGKSPLKKLKTSYFTFGPFLLHTVPPESTLKDIHMEGHCVLDVQPCHPMYLPERDVWVCRQSYEPCSFDSRSEDEVEEEDGQEADVMDSSGLEQERRMYEYDVDGRRDEYCDAEDHESSDVEDGDASVWEEEPSASWIHSSAGRRGHTAGKKRLLSRKAQKFLLMDGRNRYRSNRLSRDRDFKVALSA